MGRFHLDQLVGSDSVEVLAVADSFDVARRAVESEHPGIATYPDADRAFAHPGVEACLIATSTPAHPENVREALTAGIHVLCEKPLALDPTEARSLGSAAAEAERVLQVGFWRRFSPPWQRAKEALDAGRIGRPLMIRLSQWDADPPPSRFCDPSVSGGLAVDCGVHEFDLAEWFTGEQIGEVRAWNLPLVDPTLGEVGDVDNLVAVLSLASGVTATVDLSRNCRYGDDVRTEILGSEGALFVDLLPTGRTRLATATGVEVVEGSDSDDATADGVTAQADGFARRIRGDAVAVPGANDSARATAVGLAVRSAAASGRAVPIEPSPGS